MLIGIILLITGTFVAIKPYLAWYFFIGWQIQDAEPKDSALTIYRILALIKLLIGFIFIFQNGF
jgi:hypothetical protein